MPLTRYFIHQETQKAWSIEIIESNNNVVIAQGKKNESLKRTNNIKNSFAEAYEFAEAEISKIQEQGYVEWIEKEDRPKSDIEKNIDRAYLLSQKKDFENAQRILDELLTQDEGIHVAPFYKNKFSILRNMRIEILAINGFFPDIKAKQVFPLPLYPYFYWQWDSKK